MKNNIKITVITRFLPEQSDAARQQFAFAYTIKIHNQGDNGAQLLTRHWLIQTENGHVEEVIGEGVIGQQPHLAPGEHFEYSSGAMLATETGTMRGSYGMVNDAGERFTAPIAEFVLSEPRTLH